MAELDTLFDAATLPAELCANYRAEDCAGDLEWCADDRLRCDVHADHYHAVRPRGVSTCRYCGGEIWLTDGEWEHADECDPESTCWQGRTGPTPDVASSTTGEDWTA